MNKNSSLYNFFLNIVLSPLSIFTFVWLFSIAIYLFSIDVSYKINSSSNLLIPVFLVSITVFSLTYLSFKLNVSHLQRMYIDNSKYINTQNIQIINRLIIIVIILITLYNFLLFGPMPFFSVLGYDTINYKEYGRFKGVLIPLLTLLGLLSTYEKSFKLRLIKLSSVILMFVLYMLRGPLILFTVQYFFMNLLYNKNKNFFKKILYLSILIYGIIYILGSLRTGSDLFISFFEIKPDFQEYNMGLLWLIMYVSSPFSDLLSTLQYQANYLYGVSILNDITPALIEFSPTIASPNIKFIDGPKTYLAPFYEDFGWIGIILSNIIISIACFVIHADKRLNDNLLLVALMYSSLIFIFFTNYFFFFSNLVQLILSIVIFHFIKYKVHNES